MDVDLRYSLSLRSRILVLSLILICYSGSIVTVTAQTLDSNSDIVSSQPIFHLLDEPNRGQVALLAQRTGDENSATMNEVYAPREARERDEGVDGSNDRLIDRVVDPISWLMQFRFREDWNWPVENSGPNSQEFQFRPTIPFIAWDQVNVLRIRVPYMIQGNNAPGLGKVEMEDAVIIEPEWGRWGIGPAWRFDPHSSSGGDFQIGPVVAAVAKTKHWTYGFISQSWLGGSDSETDIQPILAYKFNEQLALALGEMQFKYDWNKGLWTQLPLGIELNYIADLRGQKMQFFVNPQYNFQTNSSNSGWTIFVGLTLLLPGA